LELGYNMAIVKVLPLPVTTPQQCLLLVATAQTGHEPLDCLGADRPAVAIFGFELKLVMELF